MSSHAASQEGETGFVNLDKAMALARAKFAAHPELIHRAGAPSDTPSTEEAESDRRLDRAIAKTERLIAQAKAQLSVPVEAPIELTRSELMEAAEAEDFIIAYQRADRLSDEMSARNQELFESLMDTIDDYATDSSSIMDTPESWCPYPVHGSTLGRSIHVPEKARAWSEQSEKHNRDGAAPNPMLGTKMEKWTALGLGNKGANFPKAPRTQLVSDDESLPQMHYTPESASKAESGIGLAATAARACRGGKASWETLAKWDFEFTW